jgi:hypothetical protein
MRKTVTALLAVAVIATLGVSAVTAAPLFTEDFNYALGSQLNGQGGWAAHSGAGTNPQTINTAGGLSYTGFPGSGVGNLLGPLATSGEDNNHAFTGQTTGAVYAAFMINVATSQATGDYLFHFFDGPIASNIFRGRVFVKKDVSTTNYAFGIQVGSAASASYTGFTFTPGSTHLLVVKYSFVPGTTNDVVSLFVDPVINCNEPNATLTTTDASQTDAVNLDGVAIRQGSSSNAATAQIDGIRVATNWADATCDVATPTNSTTWGKIKVLYR